MKTMRSRSKFYNLIELLCDKCMLQITISFNEGEWSFNAYDHPCWETEASWDIKGKDPNKILLEFIPLFIKHCQKVGKIRKKQGEDECVKWCKETVEYLNWYLRMHEIF